MLKSIMLGLVLGLGVSWVFEVLFKVNNYLTAIFGG